MCRSQRALNVFQWKFEAIAVNVVTFVLSFIFLPTSNKRITSGLGLHVNNICELINLYYLLFKLLKCFSWLSKNDGE